MINPLLTKLRLLNPPQWYSSVFQFMFLVEEKKTKAEKKDENFFKFVINSLLLFFIMLLSFLASFLQCFLFVLSSFRSWNVFEREIWNRLRQNRLKISKVLVNFEIFLIILPKTDSNHKIFLPQNAFFSTLQSHFYRFCLNFWFFYSSSSNHLICQLRFSSLSIILF